MPPGPGDGGVPYVYFVILTALDSEEHMLQGMQAGADDYLPSRSRSVRSRHGWWRPSG